MFKLEWSIGGIINRPTSGWESKLGVFSENNQNFCSLVENVGLVYKEFIPVARKLKCFM